MHVIADQTVNKGLERCVAAQGKFGNPVAESRAGAGAVSELGAHAQRGLRPLRGRAEKAAAAPGHPTPPLSSSCTGPCPSLNKPCG